MKDTPFHDPDQLMLAQADAGLVLVDPASGRIEGLNPAWPQWLGRSKASLQGTVFWEEGGWQQPDVVRTLVSLTSLPLAMPPMAVTGMCKARARAKTAWMIFTVLGSTRPCKVCCGASFLPMAAKSSPGPSWRR